MLVTQAPHREISDYAFSPDSRWIAYATEVENEMSAVLLHSLDGKTTAQVTSSSPTP